MPSPLNEMGLNIAPFKKALNEARAEIKRLEPQIKAATAQLRIMERAFAQTGAASGYTTAQIDAQRAAIEDLSVKLREASIDAEAFSDGLGGNGLLGRLKGFLLGGALLGFAHNLAMIGREGNELTKAFDELDRSAFKDTFSEADRSAKSFRNTLLDLASAAFSIPIVGQALETVAAPFMQVAKNAIQMREFRKELYASAAGSVALIDKLQALGEQRAKMRDIQSANEKFQSAKDLGAGALPGVGGLLAALGAQRQKQSEEAAKNLQLIEEKRLELVRDIASAMDNEAKARNASLAGSKLQSEISAINLEAEQRIAQLRKSVKDSVGEDTEEGRAVVLAGERKINEEANARVDMAQREYNIALNSAEVAKSIADQRLRGVNGEVTAAQQLLGLAKTTYEETKGSGEEAEASAKAQLAIAEDAYAKAQEAAADELRAIKLQSMEAQARFNGQSAIADRVAIEAKYQQKIVDAQRAKNSELVKQLQTQKNLEVIAAKAAERDKKPSERRAERKATRDMLRKAKQQDERENANRRDALRGVRGRRIDEQIAKDTGVMAEKRARNASNQLSAQELKSYADIARMATAIVGNSK